MKLLHNAAKRRVFRPALRVPPPIRTDGPISQFSVILRYLPRTAATNSIVLPRPPAGRLQHRRAPAGSRATSAADWSAAPGSPPRLVRPRSARRQQAAQPHPTERLHRPRRQRRNRFSTVSPDPRRPAPAGAGTTDGRLQTAGYRLQVTDGRLQTIDYRLQVTAVPPSRGPAV